ncbi:MAG: hypothetical protein BRC29_03380 [Nanohaloarchaea archaeon SW_7_43_1]|nr:MAG: hypothetical protein BRC29_03380 [Nanohaloarchaea archaeon SW_7_43_1]
MTADPLNQLFEGFGRRAFDPSGQRWKSMARSDSNKSGILGLKVQWILGDQLFEGSIGDHLKEAWGGLRRVNSEHHLRPRSLELKISQKTMKPRINIFLSQNDNSFL